MVRVLTVSDEPVESLWCGRPNFGVDLILGAGDLPFDYLSRLTDMFDAPCVFVPGNHDPDLSGYSTGKAGWMRAGLPANWPGPDGAVNADGRVVTAAGLRIAGLGGSIRYRPGPNQWTERQQRRRARSVARSATGLLRRVRNGIDVLLTHSPPRNIGDTEDPAHRGFSCLRELTTTLRPQVLVHGHIHPHGFPGPDLYLSGTRILNTVGYTLMDVTPGASTPTIARRQHGA
ncbi:metallophosphoesterase family protein [Antrihabitans cavernicola]|uniref:Metallophosphoesterase n=1 Tax=Antrihabitans cavernicola TaxID=2495913 RepID=A0A5A7SBM2_9NOCA|nr:metallophosphoesterase [Spelaeibacter cavernicola]KAA0022552.1 metallophosphoesterase [Spelaeibacter cavernicola]